MDSAILEFLRTHDYYYLKENSQWYPILYQSPRSWESYQAYVKSKYQLGGVSRVQKGFAKLEDFSNLIDLFFN